MEDFSLWLSQTAAEADEVVVTMDLGAGREFQLLSRMVRDGSIALVDKLYIRWHYQISVRHFLPPRRTAAEAMAAFETCHSLRTICSSNVLSFSG